MPISDTLPLSFKAFSRNLFTPTSNGFTKSSNVRITIANTKIAITAAPIIAQVLSNVISAPVLDDKVMMRYIRKMQSNVIDNIVLAKADRLSALGEDITEDMVKFNINGLNKLLQFYLQNKDLLKPLPKLLSGEDIMEIKQLKPSPILGHIIKELHEAQLNGDILTKEDAVTFVMNFKI